MTTSSPLTTEYGKFKFMKNGRNVVNCNETQLLIKMRIDSKKNTQNIRTNSGGLPEGGASVLAIKIYISYFNIPGDTFLFYDRLMIPFCSMTDYFTKI